MNVPARLAIHSLAPDRRRKDRIPVKLPTLLETPGYMGLKVSLSDLSLEGFQAELGAYVSPETIVRLNLPRIGMVLAKVIWAKQGKIGARFVNPMSSQRLGIVLRATSPAIKAVD
jgi:hypothetical protein